MPINSITTNACSTTTYNHYSAEEWSCDCLSLVTTLNVSIDSTVTIGTGNWYYAMNNSNSTYYNYYITGTGSSGGPILNYVGSAQSNCTNCPA
jgi:hypothetical protein